MRRCDRKAGLTSAVVTLAAAALFPAAVLGSPDPDQPSTSILDTAPGCVPSARYVTPSGVNASETKDPGVAPADLPGTGLHTSVPDEIAFPLFVDPLPPASGAETQDAPVSGNAPGQTPASRAGSSLYLGDVTYNRTTGDVGIGGTNVTGPSEECR